MGSRCTPRIGADPVLRSEDGGNTLHVVPTITCKLSPELDAQLTAASRARRTTKSTIVREVLEASLSRRPAAKQLRAYDIVKHLIGSLSGPRDLSHAARHLDDFGE
jgi:hypothetical protein